MATPAASDGTKTGMATQLASVAIKPVTTRYGQEVRNQLQFLFYGGAAAPSSARYSMDLSVASLTESAATIQVSTTENEPTAATITLVGTYTLTDATSTETVASGTRRIMSSYDVPKQEFAALRAQRDAQNRAARELAELLNLAVAQDLTKVAAQ